MDPTIRRYQVLDRASVVQLSLRAWAPVYVSVREVLGAEIYGHLYAEGWRARQQHDVETVLADEKMRIWVAEVAGLVVGFVAALLRVEESMGEVHMIAVDPEYQNGGIGSRLTQEATEWIRESGLPIAVISTGGDVGHAPARRTYQKAGYTPWPSTLYFKAL